MAGYYDIGAFMPSESAYTNPGEYEATQRSMAYQNATYMSNMDAFYERIEEDARQFDLSLGFKEKELSETARQADLSAETQRYGYDTQAESSRYSSDTQRDIATMETEESARQYDLGYGLARDTFEESQRQFDTNTELSREELDIANRMADIREQESQLDFYGDIFGLGDLLFNTDEGNPTSLLDDIISGGKDIWDMLKNL